MTDWKCEHDAQLWLRREWSARAQKAEANLDKLQDHIESLEDALRKIESWSHAYPLKVFPEPDFKRVAELLAAGGITLDAVSASNMRHVVEGVGKIARDALTHEQDVNSK